MKFRILVMGDGTFIAQSKYRFFSPWKSIFYNASASYCSCSDYSSLNQEYALCKVNTIEEASQSILAYIEKTKAKRNAIKVVKIIPIEDTV
jgi:hypothetical protein